MDQVSNQADRRRFIVSIGCQQIAIELIRVFEVAFVTQSAGQFQLRGAVGRIVTENVAEQANGAVILAVIQVSPAQLYFEITVAWVFHPCSFEYANGLRIVLLTQSVAAQ